MTHCIFLPSLIIKVRREGPGVRLSDSDLRQITSPLSTSICHHWESRCWERQLEFLAMRALILLSCCVGLDTSSKSCEAGNIRHSVPGSLCLSSSPLPLKITHFPIHCLSASALQKQALTSPNSLCFCAILWFVPFLIFFVLEYMTK